jgi:HlyD family secretion protein
VEPKTLESMSSELQSLRIKRGPVPRRRLSARMVIAVAVLGFLTAGFVYWRSRFVTPVVNVALPELVHNASAAPVLTASGYIIAQREAVVSSKVQGRLTELLVGVGSQVKKGQIIARLESGDYEARLQSAVADVENYKAALDENRRQLRIADTLARDGIISSDQRESVLSKVRSAEAALASAVAGRQLQEALLQDTVIRAPFSGTVVKKMSETGESVAPIPPGVNISVASGAIVVLADFTTLEMQADVSESEIGKLKTGQPAEIQLQTVPQHKYHGFLRQLVPSADRTKGTIQVLVSIGDKDSRLMPEMNADVTFLERSPRKQSRSTGPNQVSVPGNTVVKRGGKDVVFEVRQGQVWQIPIVTRGEEQGRVVITGLSGTETLVVSPSANLRDGSTVRISQP